MAGLKPIYQANTPEEALAAFENSSMGKRYPYVAQSWRSAWAQVSSRKFYEKSPKAF